MKYLLPILFLAFPIVLQAQVWTKVLGYFNEDDFILQDGGYTVAENSKREIYLGGGQVGNIIKLDQNGSVLWRKNYDENFVTIDLKILPDDQIVLIGNKFNEGEDRFESSLIKINDEGEIIWKRDYPFGNQFLHLAVDENNDISLLSVFLTRSSILYQFSDEGILQDSLILPWRSSKFFQFDDLNYSFAIGGRGMKEMTKDGTEVWSDSLAFVRNIIQTHDKQSVFLGSTAANVFFLTKYSRSGEQLWYKEYPELGTDIALYPTATRALTVDTVGNIVLTANPNNADSFMAKFDQDGNLICAETYTLDNLRANVFIRDIASTQDQGFVIVGIALSASAAFPADRVFVMKTDSLCRFSPDVIFETFRENSVEVVEDTIYAENFGIKVFPNPTDGVLRFELELTGPLQEGNTQLFFFNAFGQIIHQQELTDFQFSIDTQEWIKGLHYYEIVENGKRLASGKVVVVH
ncbi:MAG: hypothetical protein AAFO07_12230 [Bacteroidota bacterium]